MSDSAAPQTVACQAPPSRGFSRQEYWRGFLLQRIFPTQGSNLGLLLCRQMLLPSEPPGKSSLEIDTYINMANLFLTEVPSKTTEKAESPGVGPLFVKKKNFDLNLSFKN